MIVIDTSAIVAIFFDEMDGISMAHHIELADRSIISAATLVEASIVMGNRATIGPDATEVWLDRFIAAASVEVEALTPAQAQLAKTAYRAYGKGRGHPAQLNFGDCFSYALAKNRNAPLLFKGEDFSKTDIASALTSRGH